MEFSLQSTKSANNNNNIEKKYRPGILFIYNVYFYEHGNHRKNSEKDVEALTKTFKEMDAVVEDLSDDTPQQIKINKRLRTDKKSDYERLMEKMQGISERDFSSFEYVAIAVLAHGRNDGVVALYGKREECSLKKTFLEPLIRNDSLREKLKWIIAAPCRGANITLEKFSALNKLNFKNFRYYLLTFSTTEGCLSLRLSDGTLFINCLCSALKAKKLEADIFNIIKEVAKLMKERIRTKYPKELGGGSKILVQLPTINHNILGTFYFFKTKDDGKIFG